MSFPLAAIPSIAGGLMSLFGLGKGKEIPKESAATSQARSQMLNWLMPGGQLRQNTPFMGTMPSVQPAFYDALNIMSTFYGGGKKYKRPTPQGMGQILGLPSMGGFNPYSGASAYGGNRYGSYGGFNPSVSTGGINPYAGPLGQMQGGGFRGGAMTMNPWMMRSPGGGPGGGPGGMSDYGGRF